MASFVSYDEKKRRIYVVGEINDAAMHAFTVALHRLEENEGDITIILNSEGGEEISGYAIYDLIMMCRNLVVIEVYGEVSSICAAILQAADVRRMAANSIFLMHNGTIPMGEEVKQTIIVETADQIKRDSARYHSILAGRSRLSQTDIAELCEKDAYYTAEEALEAGFCDEILIPNKKFSKPKKSRKKK